MFATIRFYRDTVPTDAGRRVPVLVFELKYYPFKSSPFLAAYRRNLIFDN